MYQFRSNRCKNTTTEPLTLLAVTTEPIECFRFFKSCLQKAFSEIFETIKSIKTKQTPPPLSLFSGCEDTKPQHCCLCKGTASDTFGSFSFFCAAEGHWIHPVSPFLRFHYLLCDAAGEKKERKKNHPLIPV